MNSNKTRNMYVASDDRDIRAKLTKVTSKTYNIIMLPNEYRNKGFHSYFQKNFLKEVIGTMLMDIYFLVHSNFTICTYTSNICRLVNLLKQSTYPYTDAIESLDDSNIMSYQFYGHGFQVGQDMQYLTIAENSKSSDGSSLFQYKAGILFKQNGISESNKFSSVQQGSQNGLVFSKDVVKWPSCPSYYFYK